LAVKAPSEFLAAYNHIVFDLDTYNADYSSLRTCVTILVNVTELSGRCVLEITLVYRSASTALAVNCSNMGLLDSIPFSR
jgi:hypothetical protein